ncbi:hypothetical protein IscW_ISCW011296 [Ixodes scapularis]|uniref:Uncharacterized protein n=1 Tax=Ixodes scapularis TaxID=6945 RepID=B7Q828_IXOSC|nr:hypothetical protein IscW_ISCW011296 [Ixodes scapularis]|eukprot:XP_002412267.1 hypothetical protein IscW_ISCW011296 [Ixodes scapularis]
MNCEIKPQASASSCDDKLRTYVLSKVTFYTIYTAFPTSLISDGIGSGIANEYKINYFKMDMMHVYCYAM